MPLNAAAVGLQTAPMIHDVDARWTMAFSAGLGDTQPCYMDTTRDEEVVAHPLFPICPEWPVMLEARDLLMDDGLTLPESRRGVHAGHDMRVHRLVRPGDRLQTHATVVSLESRGAGAFMVTRLDTSDELGDPGSTTYSGALYRGVEIAGKPQDAAAGVPGSPGRIPADGVPARRVRVPIAANAAHVYTECARIWNPIHTDAQVAKEAGLPAIILHGSATLALAVSQIIDYEAGGDPRRVRRLGGSFRGMVLMPSDVEVTVYAPYESPEGTMVRFQVLNADGRPAISDGMVVID